MKSYDPTSVEPQWQKRWAESKTYETDLAKAKKPFFTHVMFPYPSGDKLHVGHWYNYAPADSYARLKKMQGFDVFSPLGFDAFGLPAENYAIKTGVHPSKSIAENVKTMTEQLRRIGCMYDWEKSLNTSTPEYYRWTQWIFLQMFKNDLAERKKGNVNFCPSCQTVLANEQVWEGKCERCDSDVVQKPLTQWYLKITKYAERLLQGLKTLDWPEKTKLMQRNWIGRSEGCDVRWKVEDKNIVLDTFTTTVDTIFGVTFMVISPEHPLLVELVTKEHRAKVEKYCNEARKKTELDRIADTQEKTGVPTGTNVLHPFTGKPVPLWVADYVLMSYGTGVVMGVPAHDQRDQDFAKKYKLPIVQSIQSEEKESFVYDDVDKYDVKGTIVNSSEFTGMQILEGRRKITDTLEKKGLATKKIQYRLRDWSIGRQRYWGALIPVVYDPEGNPHAIPEEHLPWLLPTDVEFKPTGTAPIAQSKELKERTEKIFGKGWTPEVDTMDTFVCSSFYSYRYLAEGNPKEFVPKAIEKKWMPVQMYIGGAEHACMHLIYARFVGMALKDFGFVEHAEQYQKLVHQGVITNQGAKMSKSKGNVVSPDSFIERYGSDVFRMYLMFMGPFTEGGDWSDTGIKGIDRFVNRVHAFFTNPQNLQTSKPSNLTPILHKTIKKVTEDIESLHFNTAISALMVLLNEAEKVGSMSKEAALTFVQLLAPMAPHLAEELWEHLHGFSSSESAGSGRIEKFVIESSWPTYDEGSIVENTFTLVVQVNGKVRADLTVPTGISKEEAIAKAKEQENVKKYLEGKTVKKEVYVEGKLVSLVV